MHDFLSFVWQVMNTPAGITAIAGGLLWVLNHVYAAKPAWVKFEGTIISAIRLAEKQIPDDTGNKGLAKLDLALEFVIKVYEAEQGKKPTQKVADSLREGVQILHNKLDAAGVLKPKATE